MKRFIEIHIPVTRCNLNCHYCYVPQENARDSKETPYSYTADHIGKALTIERLGGVCHFNMCGLGETLIPNEIIDITRAILEQGHYIMIVTNGTMTKRFLEFAEFPEELRKRLGFKFSFHYLELKERNLLDKFFENADIVRKNGMSFSLEMTPSDELEPYIDEVKEVCMERVGALCHVTIPRDMTKSEIELLSRHTFEEFCSVWETFGSEMFKFKKGLWGQRRTEFCYAGEWSGLLNIGDGRMTQCYGKCNAQNILEDITKPIDFSPIGHNCSMPHCYNAHSLLGLGCIPSIDGNYADERDRIDCRDNSHWLTKEMYDFLSSDLKDKNVLYNEAEEKKLDAEFKNKLLFSRVKNKLNRIFK